MYPFNAASMLLQPTQTRMVTWNIKDNVSLITENAVPARQVQV